MENEEMITLAEAEKRYGVSRDGIYYHVRKGNLTTYKKMGDRKSYLKVSDLDALAGFRPSTRTGVAKPATLEVFLDEVATGDFSKWQITN